MLPRVIWNSSSVLYGLVWKPCSLAFTIIPCEYLPTSAPYCPSASWLLVSSRSPPDVFSSKVPATGDGSSVVPRVIVKFGVELAPCHLLAYAARCVPVHALTTSSYSATLFALGSSSDSKWNETAIPAMQSAAMRKKAENANWHRPAPQNPRPG